jgi:aminoglycoside phosphotransferase family enzyme
MTKISGKLIAATTLAGALMIPALAQAQWAYAGGLRTPAIHRRQLRQHVRIQQGVRSGQLTRLETRRLARQQARIHRQAARARADGFVSRRERFRLNRQLNHSSRAIYRLKHNGRARGW